MHSNNKLGCFSVNINKYYLCRKEKNLLISIDDCDQPSASSDGGNSEYTELKKTASLTESTLSTDYRTSCKRYDALSTNDMSHFFDCVRKRDLLDNFVKKKTTSLHFIFS